MNPYQCVTCTKSDCENHRATEMYYRCYNNSLADTILDNQRVISKVGCASHSDFQSERDKVLVYSWEVMKPGFDCITRRELAYNDISEDGDDFTRLNIPVEIGDEIRIYRQSKQAGEP
jgi:hypothetical protein